MAYPSSKHLICKFLRINTFKNPYCIRFSETVNAHFCKHYSSAAQTAQVGDYKPKSAKIDRAMQEYLKRAKEYNDFMKEELKEFELGKKHLANMMGANPDNFSQEDIDKAIEYLFPSALFDPHARPLMKHPEIVFPKRKEAEFDETGRPYHHLFYTSKPNFSQLLHDAATHIQELDKHYYRMLKEGKTPEEDKKLIAAAFTWFTKENLESHIIESILDADYKAFVDVMDRLINHPYSYLAEDFIRTYQKKIAVATTKQEIPVPEKGPDGRFFITAPLNQRKTSVASVTIRSPGTGKIAINDSDINYFKRWTQSKEQILFPLLFVGLESKVDVEAKVEGGGFSSQAGAIRLGISRALQGFVSDETRLKMKVAGLLKSDPRTRERKKTGKEGARREYTWRKR